MGTEEQRMRTAIFLVALALAVTGIWAVTEVQELGNDDSNSGSSVSLDADDSAEYDDADMGEGVGFNRASFLTTSGSFTLSSGGANVAGGGGEEDELGEGAGFNRASFLTTKGSFTLSSGGANVAGGGGEEDEYDF